MTNTGTFSAQAGTTRLPTFPLNAGVVDIAAGATLSTNGAALASTGLLKGNGTLDLNGALFTNNGVVAPGASPGAMSINGDYTQGPAGVLAIDVAGRSQGVTYDVLRVTGVANLDGTLHIIPSGGYTPGAGEAFTFLTYASRNGDFTTFNYPTGFAFQAAPGPTQYTVSLPPGASTTSSVRDLPNEETQRLQERLEDVVATKEPETPEKKNRAQVCD